MNRAAAPSFEAISHDAHGAPACCSYCARGAGRVVVLPSLRGADVDPPRVGLCAYCVLDMARALQKAEERP